MTIVNYVRELVVEGKGGGVATVTHPLFTDYSGFIPPSDWIYRDLRGNCFKFKSAEFEYRPDEFNEKGGRIVATVVMSPVEEDEM